LFQTKAGGSNVFILYIEKEIEKEGELKKVTMCMLSLSNAETPEKLAVKRMNMDNVLFRLQAP
jgi:hypothetical protein